MISVIGLGVAQEGTVLPKSPNALIPQLSGFNAFNPSFHTHPLLISITLKIHKFPTGISISGGKSTRQSRDNRRMASEASKSMTWMVPESYHQLNDEADFESIISHDGFLSICGFGSLLSERSARSTFPDLLNFRVAKLHGFRRVFAHVAPVFYDRGIANEKTKEISSLSVEPCEGETLIVTLFEIKKSEVPSFIEREHEFRFLAVMPTEIDGMFFSGPAVLCARYSDEEYFQVRCKGDKELYFQRYGRHNIYRIWRDDIFPCRVYLRHCVLAAKNLGEAAYSNFLDHTFLGDRRTTIREYLALAGSGIMNEEPPEPLKFRYGG